MKWYFGLGISFALLYGVLLGSSSVSAASVFDDAIHTVDTLDFTTANCGNNGLDETAQTLINYLRDDANWSGEANDMAIDAFVNAIENGQYYISVSSGGLIDIRWSPNNNDFVLSWYNNNPQQTILEGIEVEILRIQCTGINEWRADYQGIMTTNSSVTTYYVNPPTVIKSLFLYTGDPNYPAGYEGVDIPATTPLSTVPNWYIPMAVDWRVSISDDNFFTTDMKYPFLCDDGTAPAIDVTIRNSADEIVDQQTIGSPSQIWFQAEKLEEVQAFVVYGQYYCGSEDSHQFDQFGVKAFTITEVGTLAEAPTYDECFMSEFPYVNMQSCYNNIFTFANMLYFGEIKFSNPWQHQSECKNLQVLHTWINYEGGPLCPQVPEFVRTAVTPFMTFFLGTVMAVFITKSYQRDF